MRARRVVASRPCAWCVVRSQVAGHAPGRPISHSWPNGSTAPRHQPRSSATGDASVAPTSTACFQDRVRLIDAQQNPGSSLR